MEFEGRRAGSVDLRAAYLGTLLAAATLGQHLAVLTLIGGGVFGNNPINTTSYVVAEFWSPTPKPWGRKNGRS